MSELATRLAGSNDLYAHSGRQPYASINFITAHDGFTLHDLVSYNEKHNEANGEENRDGENNNLSWNCGVEGPTDDPEIIALRERQKRNFLATLLLSQGVPMISHGDELGRTQHGQQQRLLPGQRADAGSTGTSTPNKQTLLEFTSQAGALPARRSRRCGAASTFRAAASAAAASRTSPGSRPTAARWPTRRGTPGSCARLGMLLSGNAIEEVDERGEPIIGDTLLVLLNAHTDTVPFTLPPLDARPAVAARVRHVRSARRRTASSRPAAAIRCRAARSPCSRSTPPLRERRRVADVDRRRGRTPAAVEA